MSGSKQKKPLTYQSSGVDIAAGNALTQRIKPIAKATLRPEVLTGIGGFGGLCAIPSGYREPILVSGTDGVGTKLLLAIETQRFAGLGIDLVAMCVNDILVVGAEPLFFLDYYATGQLNVESAEQIITSIGEGCQQAGCALIGGETAEMPGVYAAEEFDLAGFCVGVAEKSELIQPEQVQAGDQLIGLASSGPHSNGYSLIRAILQQNQNSYQQNQNNYQQPLSQLLPSVSYDEAAVTLGEALMAPTRIYVKSILSLRQAGIDIHAISHITGGGLTENLPRTLPQHLHAQLDLGTWQWPAIFQWLQQQGPITTDEMYRTFNCGIGLVICVPKVQVEAALTELTALGEQAWVIGEVVANA